MGEAKTIRVWLRELGTSKIAKARELMRICFAGIKMHSRHAADAACLHAISSYVGSANLAYASAAAPSSPPAAASAALAAASAFAAARS